MTIEGLYLTIGFLLGVLITGCLSLAAILIYYENITPKKTKDDNDIFE